MSLSYFVGQAREFGLWVTLGSAVQSKLGLRLAEFAQVARLVAGKHGLEVGGPSSAFRCRGSLPVYDIVGSLDNCAYAANTLWANHGSAFCFSERRPAGAQFLSEGTTLSGIGDQSYDFVLSSHMIEHTANPLAALTAWYRVLRPGGALVLLVPDKERTFDNLRATTSIEHLVSDFEAGVGEDDRTHVEEMLRNHNMRRTPDWTEDTLRKVVENNFETRGLHHHVFDAQLVKSMLEHVGFSAKCVRRSLPNNIFALALKA